MVPTASMPSEAVDLTPTPAEKEILDEIARDHGDRILTPDEVERFLGHLESVLPEDLQLPILDGLAEWSKSFPDRPTYVAIQS